MPVTAAKLMARVSRAAMLPDNFDDCGSKSPTARQLFAARLLIGQIEVQGIASLVRTVTICPSGQLLFDLESEDRRVSIVCDWPMDWHALLVGAGAALKPTESGDTAGVVRLAAAYLSGEISGPDC